MTAASPAAPSVRGAWLRAALVLAVVIGLDQLTKALVRSSLEIGQEDDVFPGLTLVHILNRGVAFSALQDQTTLVAIVIGVAVLALIGYFATHATKPLIWLPVGMLAGGALGNIIDRARIGAVTDFLKLPAWPAFNVADASITLGVFTLLYVLERRGEDADEPDRT